MRALMIAGVLLGCTHDEPRPVPATRPIAAATARTPTAPPRRIAAAEPAAITAPPAADPREGPRRAAHAALVEHCGSCHEGHLPTAKPAALAIFDLDQPDWYARFDAHRFASALGRLNKKSAAAGTAFIEFRDAELAAR